MSVSLEDDEMARTPRTPSELAQAVDAVLHSPGEPDAWIDKLAFDQAILACDKRGLATAGILPTLRDRLRRHERAVREALDAPVPPVEDLPTEEELQELSRRPVATGTPQPQAGDASGERGGDPWWSRAGPSREREDNVRPAVRVKHEETPAGRHDARESRGGTRGGNHALKAMRQWGVTFSGDRGSDADAFLERLREGRRMSAFGEEELLDSLPFVLESVALLWYRTKRSSWGSWEAFERAFRARFAAPNFQVRLSAEIIRRTQGEEEPVATYLACMLTLMARLDPPWPVERRLDYVHANLLPRYRLAVRRREFADFDTLEMMAMCAETELNSVGQHRPPPTPENSLMPSAAYRPPARETRARGAAVAMELPDEDDVGNACPTCERLRWAGESPEPTVAVVTRSGAYGRDASRGAREEPPRGAGVDPAGREARREELRRPHSEARIVPTGEEPPCAEGRVGSRQGGARNAALERVRTGRCWTCGLPGHFARECTERGRPHCTGCTCRTKSSAPLGTDAGNERRRQ